MENLKLNKIAVFCGSSKGNNILYSEIATNLGHLMAKRRYTLVYGGGGLGLMHFVSEAVLERGGEVIGVIPDFFSPDIIGMKKLTELILVSSMVERKQKIVEISDAFIALPGGYGTLDELFEILALNQLDVCQKPVVLLNINHFYDPLIQQLDTMCKEGFMDSTHRWMLLYAETIEESVLLLENYKLPNQGEWIRKIKR